MCVEGWLAGHAVSELGGGSSCYAESSLHVQDVLDVAPPGLVPAALKSVKGKRAAARSLMGEAPEHDSAAIQEHENELAEVVIVCEPEGTSLMMGGLHPRSAASLHAWRLRTASCP